LVLIRKQVDGKSGNMSDTSGQIYSAGEYLMNALDYSKNKVKKLLSL
jgi:hypothetical protein